LECQTNKACKTIIGKQLFFSLAATRLGVSRSLAVRGLGRIPRPLPMPIVLDLPQPFHQSQVSESRPDIVFPAAFASYPVKVTGRDAIGGRLQDFP